MTFFLSFGRAACAGVYMFNTVKAWRVGSTAKEPPKCLSELVGQRMHITCLLPVPLAASLRSARGSLKYNTSPSRYVKAFHIAHRL